MNPVFASAGLQQNKGCVATSWGLVSLKWIARVPLESFMSNFTMPEASSARAKDVGWPYFEAEGNDGESNGISNEN